MTGEAFTIPKTDLWLPGFFNLQIDRSYSTARRQHDVGLGWGWTHTFAWEFRVDGRTIKIRNATGQAEFPTLAPGFQSTVDGWGLLGLDRGYLLRAGDEFHHLFLPDPKDPTIYRLANVALRNRGHLALSYEDGRLAHILDTAGRSVILSPDRNGRIASITVPSPSGRSLAFAQFEYDHGGHLVAVADGDGGTWRYRYDDDRRLIDMRLPTDLTYHFRYDRKGRCVETWGDYPGGAPDRSLVIGLPLFLADNVTKAKGIHHAKLDFANGYTEVVDSARVQRFFGKADGTISKAVNAMGGVTTRTMDARGRELAREDPNGAVTRWTYDGMGNMLTETDALGRTTRVARDFEGRIVETVDAAGGRVLTPRDSHGHITMIRDQKGAVTTFQYGPHGEPLERLDPRGGRKGYEWDAHGNCVARTLPNGATVRFAYDHWGRCVREVAADGAEYHCDWSPLGRLTRVTDSLGRAKTYEYDGIGNVVAMTTPDGLRTVYEYGGLGWLANVIHPNGDRIEFRFNREGWLMTETNENGAVHELSRDRAGRIVGEHMFNGATRKYRLDPTGYVTEIDDGAGITKLENNLLGQIVKRTGPDEVELSYEYNARGEIVAAALPDVRLERVLDPTGAIIKERQIIGDRVYDVTCERDAAGFRTLLNTSLGLDLRILRDATAEVSELRDAAGSIVRYQRSPVGLPLQHILPQGGSILNTYDSAWRLTRRQVVGPGSPRLVGETEPEWIGNAPPGSVYKAYGYSPVDEITSVTTAASGTTEFDYDVRRRVVRRSQDGHKETWAADAVGNYRETGPGAPSRSYLPGSKIAARGSTDYLWDDRGYLKEKRLTLADGNVERWRFFWNGMNLLSAVELPDGRRVDFTYDAFARRATKRLTRFRVDGGHDVIATTHYVWDHLSLVHELHYDGKEVGDSWTYLFAETDDGVPIAQKHGTADWVHYVGNVMGAPDELVDGSGRLVGSLSRSTFGAATVTPGSQATTPFRAPGQFADEETGLHYNRYRYYDPEVGHYISPDPIGLEGGTNLYMFGPNPVGWFDLLGLDHQLTSQVTGPAPDNTPITIPTVTGGSGSYLSGQRPNEPKSSNPQGDPDLHTERQFLRDASAYNAAHPGALDGAKAKLNGQYPPCPQCHKAMREFADKSGMTIQYNWNGQSMTYRPNQPPTARGSDAVALKGAYAMSQDKPGGPYSWDNYGNTSDQSSARGQYRAQADAIDAQGKTTPPNYVPPKGQ